MKYRCRGVAATTTAVFVWFGMGLFVGISAASEPEEQIVMIPKPGTLGTLELETTVYRPPGDGPFPLAVINHGKALGDTRMQPRYRPISAVRYFLERGYVVAVPMRQGFSNSTGAYPDSGCNVERNGRVQARDVAAALDYLTALSYVDKARVVVLGQSHGGLTTLAFGEASYPGVKGLVNFAGGLKQTECTGWEAALADAVGSYATKTTLPSLWFYGDNDSYFSTDTHRAMYTRYLDAGGKARLVAFGTFGSDAHALFGSRSGGALWQPEVTKFLREIGLPTQILFSQFAAPSPLPAPAPTDFSSLDDVEAIPYVKQAGRERYKDFLTKPFPRAFAIGDNGETGWANGGEDPLQRALEFCHRAGQGMCRLYAVDDFVVWPK